MIAASTAVAATVPAKANATVRARRSGVRAVGRRHHPGLRPGCDGIAGRHVKGQRGHRIDHAVPDAVVDATRRIVRCLEYPVDHLAGRQLWILRPDQCGDTTDIGRREAGTPERHGVLTRPTRWIRIDRRSVMRGEPHDANAGRRHRDPGAGEALGHRNPLLSTAPTEST